MSTWVPAASHSIGKRTCLPQLARNSTALMTSHDDITWWCPELLLKPDLGSSWRPRWLNKRCKLASSMAYNPPHHPPRKKQKNLYIVSKLWFAGLSAKYYLEISYSKLLDFFFFSRLNIIWICDHIIEQCHFITTINKRQSYMESLFSCDVIICCHRQTSSDLLSFIFWSLKQKN